MKDAIQTSTEDVSIVIYDAPLPPRYLKFSKKFIRTLFIIAPIFIGLIFLTLISFILTPELKNTPRPNIPSVMNGDDSKNLELEAELKNLQASYKLVQEKLSSQKSADSNQDDIYLMGILKPYGMQNFLSQSRVTLDQFEFVPGPEKASLKFQIISKNPEIKVSGHVIVFMVSKAGLAAYPESAAMAMGQGIKFSMGEPFAVSRLRPTNAEFSTRPLGESAKFIVYIFSREGDLLLIKETEAYPIQGK